MAQFMRIYEVIVSVKYKLLSDAAEDRIRRGVMEFLNKHPKAELQFLGRQFSIHQTGEERREAIHVFVKAYSIDLPPEVYIGEQSSISLEHPRYFDAEAVWDAEAVRIKEETER